MTVDGGKDFAISRPHLADVAIAVGSAAILGATVGILLADVVAGLAVGAGAAIVFRFTLRMINGRR
ncbi:hypothetical protein ABH922_004121 [Rhodococcus sp. 27YEA15]